MSSRSHRWLSAPLTLLVALMATGTAVAAPSAQDDLQSAAEKISKLESDVARLSADFTRQRGLIGPEEAKRRYSDALYRFMVGQYDISANAFFALVESNALTDQALLQDSEWYLAESLFELNNFVIAAEAYQKIVEKGASHPFFADAVRREIEIYGILEDSARFNDLYRRYIASGTVTATDQVKYTVAKGFWRQGQPVQAKSLLSELSQGPWYARARYVQGTILAQEGDYPAAIQQFQQILNVPALTAEDREVLELARLALGRVYYEVGDYLQATSYYELIPPTSRFFADKLFELVWTFIKQEKWSSAQDQIDIFLVAFPEHRYAVQLKLIGGHLAMKQDRYDEAQRTYEAVVDQFSPIQSRLKEIEANREEASEYFTRLAEARALEMGFDVLPDYAVEMLLQDKGVSRSIEVRHQLDQEAADIAYAQAVVEELESVIMGGSESIGTFSRGRRDLDAIRDEGIRLQGRILESEMAWMKQRGGANVASQIESLEQDWRAARDTANQMQSSATNASDALQVYDAQVREVQSLAFRLTEQVQNLQVEATATRRFLKENESRLASADVRAVRSALEQIDSDLLTASQALDRLSSGATRRRVLTYVQPDNDDDQSPQAKLRDSYSAVRSRLTSLRGQVSGGDSSAFFRQSDDLWARVVSVDQQARAALTNLGVAERRELEQLKIRLAKETAELARNASELSETRLDADRLAEDATRRGIDALEEAFSSTVLQADMGIVDVYWLQQTLVSEEIVRVQKERAARETELESRFEIIRQKLQE